MKTNIRTPRTGAAIYNGHKYLCDECALLEIENKSLRNMLRYVMDVSIPPSDMEKRREWEIRIKEADDMLSEESGKPNDKSMDHRIELLDKFGPY